MLARFPVRFAATLCCASVTLAIGCSSGSTARSNAGALGDDSLDIGGVNPATIEYVDKTSKWDATVAALSFEGGRVTVRPEHRVIQDAKAAAARVVLAREAIDLNQRDQAILHAANAVRQDTSNAEAYFWLGKAVTMRGKTAEATAAFQTASDLRPDWVDARFELGMSKWRAADMDGATSQFRAILRDNPRHGPSLERLAVAAFYAGDKAEAARLAREADAVGTPVPGALYELIAK